jgi:hypothetical protein
VNSGSRFAARSIVFVKLSANWCLTGSLTWNVLAIGLSSLVEREIRCEEISAGVSPRLTAGISIHCRELGSADFLLSATG